MIQTYPHMLTRHAPRAWYLGKVHHYRSSPLSYAVEKKRLKKICIIVLIQHSVQCDASYNVECDPPSHILDGLRVTPKNNGSRSEVRNDAWVKDMTVSSRAVIVSLIVALDDRRPWTKVLDDARVEDMMVMTWAVIVVFVCGVAIEKHRTGTKMFLEPRSEDVVRTGTRIAIA